MGVRSRISTHLPSPTPPCSALQVLFANRLHPLSLFLSSPSFSPCLTTKERKILAVHHTPSRLSCRIPFHRSLDSLPHVHPSSQPQPSLHFLFITSSSTPNGLRRPSQPARSMLQVQSRSSWEELCVVRCRLVSSFLALTPPPSRCLGSSCESYEPNAMGNLTVILGERTTTRRIQFAVHHSPAHLSHLSHRSALSSTSIQRQSRQHRDLEHLWIPRLSSSSSLLA